jgi:hypothetical protein
MPHTTPSLASTGHAGTNAFIEGWCLGLGDPTPQGSLCGVFVLYRVDPFDF